MEGTIGPVGGESPGPGRPAKGRPGPAKAGSKVQSKASAAGRVRLDLAAIERSLRAVQQAFDRINPTLDTPRDPLNDAVLGNLLAGYAYLDTLLAADLNPLALGNSRHLLQLNHLVLCGTDDATAKAYAAHLHETERRFYEDPSPGGVRALMDSLGAQQGEPVWRRAAGAYIQVLSRPQLFIEGNHRTGALIMSAMLLWEGKPPFALTVSNAKAFFDPSSLTKNSRKRSLQLLLRRPKLIRRFADLLKDEANWSYLERGSEPVGPARA